MFSAITVCLLFSVSRYVRELRGELQAAQQEEACQLKAKANTEYDVTELKALIQ
jgi:hypothetical protein